MAVRIALTLLLVALLGPLGLALLGTLDRTAAWQPAAPTPEARFEAPPAVVDGRLYLFGGFGDPTVQEGELAPVRHLVRYDPTADRWERLGDAPQPLSHILTAVDGPYVWIAGGFVGAFPGTSTREVWRYDTRDDSWQAGPPLPEPRAGGGLARVGRSLYYFGGYLAADRETGTVLHWALDLDGGTAWEPRAPLPEMRGHCGVAVHDGLVYALGGAPLHHPEPKDVRTGVRYDPARDAWEAIAEMPTPRSHFEPGTLVLDDRIVIFGGRDNQSGFFEETAMSDVTAYDVRTDTWTPLPSIPVPLRAPVVVRMGDELILTSGSVRGSDHPRAETWRLPCHEEAESPCNPDWGSASARVAAGSRAILKTFARATPWPFGRIWSPHRRIAVPYARNPSPGAR